MDTPPPVAPRPRSSRGPVGFLASLVGILLLIVAVGGYEGYLRITALSTRVGRLELAVATTTSELQQGLQENRDSVANALQQQDQKAADLQNQFGTITSSVNVLQKLSTLDPELLKKYSKVYFLNDNYMPASLETIPKEETYSTTRDYTILTQVFPYLNSMINAAKNEGVDLLVQSAYRSFDEQQSLKGQYSVTYGAGTANSFSADQGYSEHQLGTAVDMTTNSLKGQLTGFDKTSAYTWMTKNAYRYGFVLSYPAGNKYYVYEPWHWRFVGQRLAEYLHNNNLNFYDMDQRQIDNYLPSIFDPQ